MPQQSKSQEIIDGAFRHAVIDLKIAPSEFWAMSLPEFNKLIVRREYVSSLSADDIAELKAYL
jgi:hypothetical protein